MDLTKSGRLLCELRKAKGMTQKQVADKLNICAKTVSKWETGRGFPDVSAVAELAKVLDVSADAILSGSLIRNMEEIGNMKKTKFYVCPQCGSIMQGVGECRALCCSKQLDPLKAVPADEEHSVTVNEVENDLYITFEHEMTKEHFIGFVAYVTFDRALMVRLYPEQDCAVRFPKMYGGRLYYYCSKHGLFECELKKKPKPQKKSMTALMSAFARAYHTKNSENPIFCDSIARKLFSNEEYAQLERYISSAERYVKAYVNTQLAPTPVARAKFCEDSLKTAVMTGTEQYVILGSGLDTFALRYDGGLKIFELDKAQVIEDKKRRIRRAGLNIPQNTRLAAVDLAKGEIRKALEENGFDKSKKTFFSCLGLFYYMSREEISRLLEDIADIAAEGSAVVFDFADNHLFASKIKRVREMLDMAEQSGEPMRSCFGFGELERLLERHGFLIYEFLNEKDIQDRYFRDRTDTMTAFEHINYALAVER
ncbi:MAG: SAM-dependent methyltransferase [Clostridiales bacterium]|nr:SAM-dependent methyltransferase [Clostridiales bacterium]